MNHLLGEYNRPSNDVPDCFSPSEIELSFPVTSTKTKRKDLKKEKSNNLSKVSNFRARIRSIPNSTHAKTVRNLCVYLLTDYQPFLGEFGQSPDALLMLFGSCSKGGASRK